MIKEIKDLIVSVMRDDAFREMFGVGLLVGCLLMGLLALVAIGMSIEFIISYMEIFRDFLRATLLEGQP